MIHHHNNQSQVPGRVVILGGSGFVGRSLAAQLGRHKVQTVSLSSADLDLTAPESAERLAAIISPQDALVFASALTPDKGKDLRAMIRNLAMAESVCAALVRSPCSHVVYLSSDAVYPDDAALVSEETLCASKSLYGQMHVAREQALCAATAAHRVPLLILRLSILHGVGDTHNSYGPNRFLRSALVQGRIDLFGEGEEKRDHVWIDDVCRLVREGLYRRSEGLLNVATGSSWSFRQVAELIADSLGTPVVIQGRPRQALISHKHFDISNTIKAFPGFYYTPLRTALHATVAAVSSEAAARSAAA
jgi:UDP-glucose 4-epimerase